MQLRNVNLRSVGPSVQKLWPTTFFAKKMPCILHGAEKKIRDVFSSQVSGRAQLPGVFIYWVDHFGNYPISGGHTCIIWAHPSEQRPLLFSCKKNIITFIYSFKNSLQINEGFNKLDNAWVPSCLQSKKNKKQPENPNLIICHNIKHTNILIWHSIKLSQFSPLSVDSPVSWLYCVYH